MILPRPAALMLIFSVWSASAGSLSGAPLRLLARDDSGAARKIGLQDSKGVQELKDFHPNKRSAPVGGAAEGTPLQLVALDRPAADLKTPLVLILPAADQPGGLRAVAIEDDRVNFAWACLLLVNLTEQPLVLRHEKETTQNPGELKAFKIDPGGEARNMGVQMHREEDPDTVLYSAVWEHDPNVRKLILVVRGTPEDGTASELRIIPEDRRVEH